MSLSKEDLIPLAQGAAKVAGLDPALVCAIVEQESGWNAWAVRYEPAFDSKYVSPLPLSPTEDKTRSMSFGLMQLMGQSARELGFKGRFLTELCDPLINLTWGCKHFQGKLKRANGDVHQALLYWNGGANKAYPDQVLARQANYPPI